MKPVNNQGHRSIGINQRNVNNKSQSNNNSVGAIRGKKVDRLINQLNELQPEDPILGKPDNKFTTFGIGEEDRVESKPKIPASKPIIDPISGKPDNKFTTFGIGEEDGAGSKPKIPQKDLISKKPEYEATTLAFGKEGDNGFIYSQHTRLNIYKPQSFTS
jgi:hypothetical protein